MRSAILPLARRYHTDRMFIRPRIRGTIYTDTMNGRYKSLDGNKHAQIFAYETFFATAYPMEHKSSAGQALKQFISDFGIPDKLVCDGAAEQVGKRTEFQSTVRKHAINLHVTKPHNHNHSNVEGIVWEIQKRWFRIMLKKKVPRRLWTTASSGYAQSSNSQAKPPKFQGILISHSMIGARTMTRLG